MQVSTQVLVRMPPTLKRRLDRIAKKLGTTINSEAVEAIRNHVEKREALPVPAE